MKIQESLRLKGIAENLIPGITQTFSKSPLMFTQGVSPVYVERGEGCFLWDVDGNRFIDYTMALAPCILGYNYEPINRRIVEQLSKGIIFTLPHRVEVELSEKLVELIPCAEMVRFGKNGSDMTTAAVRLARAYTGRDYIACCGYHGWHDWYIAVTSRNYGIPEDVGKYTLTFKYNDIESLERLFDEYSGKIAAVIMEPVSVEPPKDGFLEGVRDITRKNGALLIFDEIVTGFRFSIGGAQQYFGVIPDLACFGKAMANGMPISAIVGRKEIMKLFERVFCSFTFSGETLSIVAALQTIEELINKNVIKHIWGEGKKLMEGLKDLIREKSIEHLLDIKGYPPRNVFLFKGGDEETSLRYKTLFQQECIKRGLLFTGAHNLSFAHTQEVIEKTLSIYEEVMEVFKKTIEEDRVSEAIEGSIVQPVFRKV